MTVPATGVVSPQGTPAPAPGTGNPPATPPAPAQGGATGTPPAGGEGQKVVPIAVMHEERDKRQAAESANKELQAEIENLKNMIGQYQPSPYQQQPYQPAYQPYPYQPAQPHYQPYPVPPQNINEQIGALYQDDVRKGVQAEMMAMMQYRDAVDSKVDQEFEAVRGKAEDFGKYEGKVRSYIRGLPYEAKAQPNIVQAAYLMVRGQDVDNIIKAREAAMLQKQQGQQAAMGLNGTFSAPGTPSGQPTLNQEEMQAAAALRMTPDEYLKYRG